MTFLDARQIPRGSELSVDLCIIGGGAAGITVAREFDGGQHQVLLLESGALEIDSDTQRLYDGDVVGLPYFPLTVPRLRYFGGTTNHWGGYTRPFEPDDFQRRDAIPYTGWPIDLSDLQPYYDRAWRICGLPADSWSADRWGGASRYAPLRLRSDRVVTRVAQIVPRDARAFGRVYGQELRQSSNVTVCLRANVTSIETDEDGVRTTSVQVTTLDGNHFTVEAAAYVLACGGIENPRLLLASTTSHGHGIGNAHDMVGRFFLEHPRFEAATVVPVDRRLELGFYEAHRTQDGSIRGYLALSTGTKHEEGLLDVQVRLRLLRDEGFARARNAPPISALQGIARPLADRQLPPELYEHVTTVLRDVASWQSYTLPGAPLPVPHPDVVRALLRSDVDDAERLIPHLLGDIAATAYGEVGPGAPLQAVVLVPRFEPVPNPDSRVTLSERRDALGMPQAQLDWRLSAADQHAIRRTLEIIGEELGLAGLGRLRLDWAAGLEEGEVVDWPEDLAGGFHHMGTTRMSSDPREGVVDDNCLVHGMRNLYVAGSSVFPTAAGGTPTLMLVSLALRLARHLKAALR